MKNELAVRSWAFDDNLIRTVKFNEEAWFVGKDVAQALGYQNTNKTLNDHVDEEDKNTVAIRDVLKREQNTTIINESGLYSLIFGSKLETARTMEPLANMREKEIKENAKLLDFVAESISITGSDTDTIDADTLYVLYIDHTEGDVLKSGTFKNRMEILFPQLRYAMSEKKRNLNANGVRRKD